MEHKLVSDFWLMIPVLIMISVNARADDLMSTYQLATEQDLHVT